MKALEHLVIHELNQLHALESKLQSAFTALKDASEDQVANFAAGLTELQHRAARLERILDNGIAPESIAA